MAWDPDRYEAWFDTPEGQYALDQEARLLQDVLAGWPRRKHKLLEIGCGTGLFLEMLYQMGLDVTGMDNSPEMIMAARKRFGNRAELHLGHGEHMGYSDNEFDYALLWSVLEFTEEPEAMLTEAARVAEKGLLIGFLNKNSLYYTMNVRNSGSTLSKANWFTWCEMQDLIHNATGFRPTLARSVLPGPAKTWKPTGLCNLINSKILPPSLGAFVAVRVDFTNMKPLTPLFAWKSEPEMG
ncbi:MULTISPECIES: class I SAM-dependent methyltransferase [unclassified Pseudodesulfovibrio]|uniref:class I SAM-dependent methyltransferase n=1 Tax=unclassified Pseudodesulfovibrio TaxID=2661612 RepID=UPI000FEB8AEB|nr:MULTISPECIES: class I SAM-dependent methyltransferase [unclassified Pseudodesulfovibrio]MCJ2165630.1 class I SAM-dependent methyltransferase [Pseudodesulfovibrio sp. S3-i]RWU03037.1 methyltransferase domain-containing protein [Pseudodesulfovibrio sp. S3]